ncbi:RNA-binding 39 [Olea europaea subsp. europaea]|uniref:RNA-binding 39 n=1 Tax=Olea europaea subsp. europaea TaxID=158383 RepID=A0A8S0VD94_OLEEU|nr:RNA-binding 39 [Olea europaea subsp. europaea]
MDFDEYDYLEKAVEETNVPSKTAEKETSDKEKDRDRSEKGYRRRDRIEDNDLDEEERNRKSSGKKSRADRDTEENGRDRDRDRERERDREKERDRDRERSLRRRSSDRDLERERDRERRSSRELERDREKRDKDKEREGDRERDKERREREREREKGKEREREVQKEREREKEKERPRSRSRPTLEHERDRDLMRGREHELRDSRRFKDKKEATEPEADPERDQRTVFAYQMPLKATERDVYEFFSQAGKVRDVRLIMDRNSRRSKGVGYIEFYDAMSVPMAIALSGHLLFGQPVMVKPSEAEKNLVQSNTTVGGSGVIGPYGAADRKLYVGNLHFNMTEFQLKQIFEAFGPVELVQLPTDPETGHCKGFGFVQFAQLEHAKAAESLNGKLEIAGRTIKVSSVTDHVGVQDSGTKTADFDDDDGGGLSLNAQSRAMLMQKLDRSGTALSVTGPIGVPALNGLAPQQSINLPMNPSTVLHPPVLPTQLISMAPEPIGNPSECLLLKNMFDPTAEVEPEFDLDIRDDVQEECSKYGVVKHAYVDKNSAGYVYLRFESVDAASRAQQAMHKRWFARRLISAIFLQPYEYDAKFKGAA